MRATAELAILDTDVLVHLLRMDDTGKQIEAEHSLLDRVEKPLIASVVEGELLGLAKCWSWGSAKMDALRALLAELVRVDVGLQAIIEAYADLYCDATKRGLPRGENDLWIAATAKATQAVLYTCNASHFEWMAPQHLTLCAVPQGRRP